MLTDLWSELETADGKAEALGPTRRRSATSARCSRSRRSVAALAATICGARPRGSCPTARTIVIAEPSGDGTTDDDGDGDGEDEDGGGVKPEGAGRRGARSAARRLRGRPAARARRRPVGGEGLARHAITLMQHGAGGRAREELESAFEALGASLDTRVSPRRGRVRLSRARPRASTRRRRCSPTCSRGRGSRRPSTSGSAAKRSRASTICATTTARSVRASSIATRSPVARTADRARDRRVARVNPARRRGGWVTSKRRGTQAAGDNSACGRRGPRARRGGARRRLVADLPARLAAPAPAPRAGAGGERGLAAVPHRQAGSRAVADHRRAPVPARAIRNSLPLHVARRCSAACSPRGS